MMLLPTSCRKHTRLLALQQAGQHITESRALLYRIARNLVIDRYRRGQVQGWTTDNHSLENFPAQRACEPDALVASSQVLQAVLTTIDALPLRCREAFILHRFDGLSHSEVAEHMGISRKAVEQHIQHAMQVIRRCRMQMEGDTDTSGSCLATQKKRV